MGLELVSVTEGLGDAGTGLGAIGLIGFRDDGIDAVRLQLERRDAALRLACVSEDQFGDEAAKLQQHPGGFQVHFHGEFVWIRMD